MFKEKDLDPWVRKYGLPDVYLGHPNLAHSKVAAAYMEQELGVTDRDLLNAVSYHTTGRAGMSTLEKILFLADSTEPGRTFPGVDELRRLADVDLDAACAFSCRRTVKYVRERGLDLDEDTLAAERYFEELLKEKNMDPKSLALEAAKVLDSKRGTDITILDIAEKSGFADYLIIVTAGSERQAVALTDAVEDRFAELGVFPRGVEGRSADAGWILTDYGDVVVNVFTENMRAMYDIEKVWADCDKLDPGVEA